MTGYNGGTNHSAAARSNERAARQDRSNAAIDAKYGADLTFNGVLETLYQYSLTHENDLYTAKLPRSLHPWILSMLEDVHAILHQYRFGSNIIQFTAPRINICKALREHPFVTIYTFEAPIYPALPFTLIRDPKKLQWSQLKARMVANRQEKEADIDKRIESRKGDNPVWDAFQARSEQLDEQHKARLQEWSEKRREGRGDGTLTHITAESQEEKIDYKALTDNSEQVEARRQNMRFVNYETTTVRHGSKKINITRRIK